jgi:hypothetical protein
VHGNSVGNEYAREFRLDAIEVDDVFEHVRGIDCIEGSVGKGKRPTIVDGDRGVLRSAEGRASDINGRDCKSVSSEKGRLPAIARA